MPARVLTVAPVYVGCCDVLGQYAANAVDVVEHLALAAKPQPSFTMSDLAEVYEMPVRDPGRRAAAIFASAELTYKEMRKIEAFCLEHIGEHRTLGLIKGRRKFKGYVVRPHCKPFNEGDGTKVRMRFSCVGFVIEAYREARINLVVTDDQSLPLTSLDTLKDAFPPLACDRWAEVNREYDLGLDPAANEWRVVLPGYAVKSLARTHDEIRSIPYVPKIEDAKFY